MRTLYIVEFIHLLMNLNIYETLYNPGPTNAEGSAL